MSSGEGGGKLGEENGKIEEKSERRPRSDNVRGFLAHRRALLWFLSSGPGMYRWLLSRNVTVVFYSFFFFFLVLMLCAHVHFLSAQH